MRRWFTGVALGAVAMLTLAGCGRPAGIDGDLVNNWSALTEPTAFAPEAGTCHPTAQEVGFLSAYNPVDCAQSHQVETLHVGTLSGENANRTSPPVAGTTALQAAYAECDQKVNETLGGDWQAGRINLLVVFPSPAAWNGGARWFRCDVSEIESLDDPSLVSRTGSLVGALRAGSELAHGCFQPKPVKDSIDAMVPVACTTKHKAEFVGVFQAPASSYAAFLKESERTHRKCRSLIAGYVKVPDNGDLKYRTGSIFYHASEADWRNGNRGVQCFLWVDDRNLTRSLKGTGGKGLPLR